MGIKIALILLMIFFVYAIIVRYRSKDKVIVKGMFDKGVMTILICCICLVGLCNGLLIYKVVEEFYSTREFRKEYSIGFYEIINDKKFENKVNELQGEYKEWGDWALGTIRQNKREINVFLILVVGFALSIQGLITRFEHDGIRSFWILTPWKEYRAYSWHENRIYLSHKNIEKTIKLVIKEEQKGNLDEYLRENTDLIKENS